jgi:hypothetical protein
MDFVINSDPERVCSNFVRPKLGAKAANRFLAAINRPSWLLREHVLKPNLFRCLPGQDIAQSSYIPVAVTPKTPGRNHFLAQQLARGDDFFKPCDPALWGVLPYFANVLRACRPEWDELTGGEVWQPPSERVLVAPYHIFTFEFDVPDIGFLREQFGWLMTKKKPIDSLMGQLFLQLSGFADFSGLTVVYGGNKSLHIHLTFRTDLSNEVLNLGAVANPRSGFIEHWLMLRPIVCEVLRVPDGVEPDANLRLPEMYRRTPNSFRYIDNEDHLLGVPPGEFVQQVTLFELWRKRASAGATATFFRPGPFHAPQQEARRSTGSARTIKDPSNLTAAEISFCEERLRAWVGKWPKLDRLAHRAGRWEARFYNSPADRNASSIMREDFATIQLIGTGADGLKPKPLLFPLGRMIWLWVEQMNRQRQSKGEEPTEVAVLLRRPNVAGNHPMEVAFRDAAVDPDAARLAAGLIIFGAVVADQLVLIRGAEGLGKTSTLLNNHHKIIQRIEAPGDPALALYAFGDYLTAEAKCSDFNNAQEGNGFVGVVLLSFAEAYRRVCKDLRLAPISLSDAAKRGYSSLWTAVKAHQPAVMQAFKAMHFEIWATVGDARLVGFTVHQVLHAWEHQSPTRANVVALLLV